MKMPGQETTDSGLYDYEDDSCFSDTLDATVEEMTAPPENDFSEYLWMEHEEEFDKEVMQRLEEEALMEECMEAFMNDENNMQWVAPAPVDIAKTSKLNPEAAEFVPLSDRPPANPPTSQS